jgi:hypothetical protein
MNPIFKKLNFKGQSPIFILNTPPAFAKDVDEMKTETEIKNTIVKAKEVTFFLAFVTKQNEVDELSKKISGLLSHDGVLWFAYPKGTSKNYKCEFNRDSGWQELGRIGFEPVRMVAIDEDWSALRFKKAENIKSMTRSSAISETGRKRIHASRKGK